MLQNSQIFEDYWLLWIYFDETFGLEIGIVWKFQAVLEQNRREQIKFKMISKNYIIF